MHYNIQNSIMSHLYHDELLCHPVPCPYNNITSYSHPSLHQHHTQLSDDAEEVQEEVRVAARAAEIAAEKAAQEVAQEAAGPYSLLYVALLYCTMLYYALLYSTVLCTNLYCHILP